MDKSKQNLKGSKSRDEFRWRHKQRLPKTCYGCDIDLVWNGKKTILAAFDYKLPGDKINYNEKIAYTDLSRRGIPVFVVYEAQPDKFKISWFQNGEYKRGDDKLYGWGSLAKLRIKLEKKERLEDLIR